MRSTLGIARFGAWLGIGLAILYLLFLGGGWVGIYAVDLRILSVVVVAIALALWAYAIVRNRAWLPASALLPAFGVALLAFAIGLVFSRFPRLGVEYFAYAWLLVALYLLFTRLLADERLRPRVMAIVVAVALLQGLAYVAEVGQGWMRWWDAVGQLLTPPLRPEFASLLLGNPSAVMTVQVLLSTAAIAWVGWSTPVRALTTATLVGLALFATIASGSRAGWLAIVGALVLIGAARVASPTRRAALWQSLGSRNARIAVVVGALGVAAIAAVVAPGVLFRAGAGSDASRLANYAEATRMFQDSPLVGTGPGTWVAQRVRYALPTEPDHYIPYAHNLPLQTLAEFGLVGAVAGLVAAIFLARLVLPALDDRDPTRRRMAWAAAFGTAYFVAHQLLDFYGNMPAALFAYAIPIAYLDATRPAAQERWARPVALVGGLGAVVAIAGLLLAESVALKMNDAVVAANAGRWAEALPAAREAAAADPAMSPYQLALGLIALHAGDRETAESALRRSVAVDDYPPAWVALAAIDVDRGDQAAARAELEAALRMGRQWPATIVSAADLALQLDDRDEAISLLGDAVRALPSLAGDPGWTDDPRLSTLRDEVFARAREGATADTLFDLALASGQLEEAQQLAVSNPDHALLDTVVRGWRKDPEAVQELLRLSASRPFDFRVLTYTARVASWQGDEATANRVRRWMEGVNATSSIGASEYRFAIDPPPGRVTAQATVLYGHYTYRRPTPVDQVPPGLLHLVRE